jgi:hypothetical protein
MPQPSRFAPAGLDDSELRIAVAELAAGRELLRAAHEIAEPRERLEALRVAVGRLALASRAIDEVVDRRG